MRRRGFGPMVVLLLTQAATHRLNAQSVIQRPSCSGVVHGTVSSSEGHPAKEFRVVAYPLGVSISGSLPAAYTDHSGEYRFEKVCPGRYTVLPDDEKTGYPRASPSEYQFLYGHEVEEVTLTDNIGQAELPLKLLAKPGRIVVRIVSRRTKAEILKFTVRLNVPGQEIGGEQESLFYPDVKNHELLVPPDKIFVVHIAADGFHDWSSEAGNHEVARVQSGTRATLEAQLEPLR